MINRSFTWPGKCVPLGLKPTNLAYAPHKCKDGFTLCAKVILTEIIYEKLRNFELVIQS